MPLHNKIAGDFYHGGTFFNCLLSPFGFGDQLDVVFRFADFATVKILDSTRGDGNSVWNALLRAALSVLARTLALRPLRGSA